MKKIQYFLLILFTLIIGTNLVEAKEVNTNITIYWFDINNYYNERPTSIELPLKNMKDETDIITLDLQESDAKVNVRKNFTTWTFNITVDLKKDETFYPSYLPIDCYELDSTNSNGLITIDGGSIEIYYFKNTSVNSTITIKYNDDNGRDAYSRDLTFAITSTDSNYPSKETFYIIGKSKYNNYTDKDTLVKETLLKGIKSTTETDDDYMVPMEYELQIMNSQEEGEFTYEWDGYNLTINVNRPAKTTNIPLKVIWDDNDNSKNQRPTSIKIEAYDQNGIFEQDFEINNSTWEIEKELFKNMQYSYGKAIDYEFKVSDIDNYEFSIELVDETYVITGKYVEEETKEIENLDNIENPNTADNLYTYITLAIISIIGITFSIKYLKKSN